MWIQETKLIKCGSCVECVCVCNQVGMVCVCVGGGGAGVTRAHQSQLHMGSTACQQATRPLPNHTCTSGNKPPMHTDRYGSTAAVERDG